MGIIYAIIIVIMVFDNVFIQLIRQNLFLFANALYNLHLYNVVSNYVYEKRRFKDG